MEQAFKVIGFGKFQKQLMFLGIITGVTSLLYVISAPFLLLKPILYCRRKNEFSENEFKFYKCPHEEIKVCNKTLIDYVISEESVHNISYDFGFYCEDNIKARYVQSIYFLGLIVSLYINSPLTDKYGRKIVCLAILLISPLNFLLSTFASNFTTLCLTHFMIGACEYIALLTSLYMSEFLEQKLVAICMSLKNLFFPIAGVMISFFFMRGNSWSNLYLIGFFCNLLIFIFAYNFLIESPKWLKSQGHTKELIKSLEDMAKSNDKEEEFKTFMEENGHLLNDQSIKPSKFSEQNKKTYSFISLYSVPSQQKTLIIITFIWFSIGLCFFGLSLNIESLSDNPAEPDLIFGSVIFVASGVSYVVSGLIANVFGRVRAFNISCLCAGIGYFLIHFIKGMRLVKIVLVFFTAYGLAGYFNTLFIYTSEAFPISIKGTAFGSLFMISRFGGLLVPIISPLLPSKQLVFGTFSLISGIISFWLKETLGTKAPERLPEDTIEIGPIVPVIKTSERIELIMTSTQTVTTNNQEGI